MLEGAWAGSRKRRAIAGRLLAACVGLCSIAPALAQGEEIHLLGVEIDGREVAADDVLRLGEGWWIPSEPLAEFGEVRFVESDGSLRGSTPLGEIDVPPEAWTRRDDRVYLSESFLRLSLGAEVGYDANAMSIRVAFPWRFEGRTGTLRPTESPVPDAVPPRAGVSLLRTLSSLTNSGGDTRFRGTAWMHGRVGGGHWQLRYRDDLESTREMADYAWTRMGDRHLWMAGHQRVAVHPLLQGLEMTGAQYAWTNVPSNRRYDRGDTRELVSRRLIPSVAFRGIGPAAGVAELWIDGRLVDRRQLPLDGSYAFENVGLRANSAHRVEVRLYEPSRLDAPIEIREQWASTSEQLLRSGERVMLAGAGIGGNAIQSAIGDARAGGLRAFAQGRFGLHDDWTLELAGQRAAGRTQFALGTVGRPFEAVTTAFGLGHSGGAWGAHFDLDFYRPRWRTVVRSVTRGAGFEALQSGAHDDHFLEAAYRPHVDWELAAIGRVREAPTADVAFLRPALAWRPRAGWWLRIRPDSFGEYRFDLQARLTERQHAYATRWDDRNALGHWVRLHDRMRLHSRAEDGGDRPYRIESTLSGWARLDWPIRWSGGLVLDDGEVGISLGTQAPVGPGMVLRVQFETLSAAGVGGDDGRWTVQLQTDWGFDRGRLVPASSQGFDRRTGGFAARVRFEMPDGSVASISPDDYTIRIDGRALYMTAAGGRFFAGDLEPGVYWAELDPHGLPIEWVPERTRIAVQVEAGVVTTADFVLRPEYGAAGRVRTGDGEVAAGVGVRIASSEGTFVRTVETDRFGLYRFDGLVPGRYRIEPVGAAADERFSVEVEVVDDFLFGIDLVDPAAGNAAGVTTEPSGDAVADHSPF